MAPEKKETVKEQHETKKAAKLIWQSPKGPNAKVAMFTLQTISDSGRLTEQALISPNSVGQYVLLPTALKYEKQLEAMQACAAKHKLYLIDTKMEGVLPTAYEGMELPEETAEAVSTLKAELIKAQQANAEMQKKLADLEAKEADADKK